MLKKTNWQWKKGFIVTIVAATLIWNLLAYLLPNKFTLDIFLSKLFSPPAPTSTTTPVPTSIPNQMWSVCVDGRTIINSVFENNLGRMLCLYGNVTEINVVENTGIFYNIFPLDKQAPYLIFVDTTKYVFDFALVGDCIYVEGVPDISLDKSALFSANRFEIGNASDQGLLSRSFNQTPSPCKKFP